MSEKWLPVVGFPNYEVSDMGRVRSLLQLKWGGQRAGYYLKEPQILRPGIASNGYPTVALGRGNTRTVHSLVADAFIGPCPKGQEVRHRDDERWNPALENVEYGTRSDNMKDAAARNRRNDREYGLKAAATKDARYPGWRSLVFKPVKFSERRRTT